MEISTLAKVSPKAKLGARVSIGDFTIVHDNVVLGDDVVIESHSVIGIPTALAEGKPLVIGKGSKIRSHAVMYEGSTFGPGLNTGHRIMIREKITAGRNLQIGTMCDFEGEAEIGDFVRTHSNVHIGQKSKIGSYVWIFPNTVLTNDPHPPSSEYITGVTVEDYAVIATMCCVLPGVRIGTRALVGAQTLVAKDVAPDTLVAGVPGKKICNTKDIKFRDESNHSVYPWMRHFHRGYPEDVVAAWIDQYGTLANPKKY